MISKLREKMLTAGLDALLLCDPDSVYYFTGSKIAPGERMYLLAVTERGLYYILPEMFAGEARAAAAETERVFFKDTDDYIGLASNAIKGAKTIGVDKNLAAKFLLPLMEHMSGSKFVDGSHIVDGMRMYKSAEECEKMRISSLLNDRIMESFALFLSSDAALGISEKAAAKKLMEISENLGAEGASFDAIVCFGGTSAQPHHEPAADVCLKIGDAVIVDQGFVKNGYCSDMTRSFLRVKDGLLFDGKNVLCEDGSTKPLQAPDASQKKYIEIYEIARNANLAGIAAVKPGAALSDVDAAARDYIESRGYGEFFTHRLGHGIGIAVHEFPDVSATSSSICGEGMIFSVEPGIYHEKSDIGVRVEDLVLVTKDGCEVLNKYMK